jgi:basic amino acid/polyamine antiporter, APA family
MPRGLFRTKNLQEILASTEQTEYRLKRVLGPVQLTALGVGAIVGAGIFALVGTAAAGTDVRLGAGPALILSFVITGLLCALCALCYAEFASVVPISGSAYTYSYFTLGELAAWLIGWDLILEYAVGNIAVAVSWSGYFQQLLRGFGLEIPFWLGSNYNAVPPELLGQAPHLLGFPIVVNLPAVAIVALITMVLVVGIRESSQFNTAMVVVKLLVLGFFIVAGALYVQPENWTPFAPHGWRPVITSAALIFFAYIGFDAISTAAEETRNPQRDLPIGMIASLIICTVLYVAVAAVLTGMVPYTLLGVPEPLSVAFTHLDLGWAAGIVAFGAVVANAAVLLVFQLGQPRIFFAMARDGLLPQWFTRIHPRFRTPHVTTIVTGVFVAFFAAFMDIGEAAELTNIGTLFAFAIVAAAVLILRRRSPHLHRPFRVPFVPFVPLAGIAICLILMLALPSTTWVRFAGWMALGLLIYFAYGRRRSRLGNASRPPSGSPGN